MNERDRLTQLRALRARIERLPESAERDRMLAEIGRRTVDVECSTPATPLRAPVVLHTAAPPGRAPGVPPPPPPAGPPPRHAHAPGGGQGRGRAATRAGDADAPTGGQDRG